MIRIGSSDASFSFAIAALYGYARSVYAKRDRVNAKGCYVIFHDGVLLDLGVGPMIIYKVDSRAAWWWWSPGKINLIIINIMVKNELNWNSHHRNY
jgi:hypothetical protein